MYMYKCKKTTKKSESAKFMFRFTLRKFDHVSPHFRDLSWLNMHDRMNSHHSIFIQKAMVPQIQYYLKSTLIFRSSVHSLATRQGVLTNIPWYMTTLFLHIKPVIGYQITLKTHTI